MYTYYVYSSKRESINEQKYVEVSYFMPRVYKIKIL